MNQSFTLSVKETGRWLNACSLYFLDSLSLSLSSNFHTIQHIWSVKESCVLITQEISINERSRRPQNIYVLVLSFIYTTICLEINRNRPPLSRKNIAFFFFNNQNFINIKTLIIRLKNSRIVGKQAYLKPSTKTHKQKIFSSCFVQSMISSAFSVNIHTYLWESMVDRVQKHCFLFYLHG